MLSLFFLGCSSDSDRTAISPKLNLENLSPDGCLSLQSLADTINSKFNFPLRKTTLNFQNSKSSRQLDIRNFGIQESYLTHFPYLRNPIQQDCKKVTLHTAYGRPLNYNVLGYTKNSILLQKSSEQEISTEKIRSEAYAEEPELERLEITITSPLSAVIVAESEIFLPRCELKASYTKTTSLRWSDSLSNIPNFEQLKPEYRQRFADNLPKTESATEVITDSIKNITEAQLELSKELRTDICH